MTIPSSLTCGCNYDWEPEPGSIVWYELSDYSPYQGKRRTRCHSCNLPIAPGDLHCIAPRYKIPESDIELAIYGEDGEIPRAPARLCESCSDIAHSLEELGFCPAPWGDQRELLREYQEMKGIQQDELLDNHKTNP